MRIQARIISYTALLVFALGLAFFWFIYRYERSSIRQRYVRKATILADVTSRDLDLLMYRMDVRAIRRKMQILRRDPEVIEVRVLDKKGRLLTDGTEGSALRGMIYSHPFFRRLIEYRSENPLLSVDGNLLLAGRAISTAEREVLGYLVLTVSLVPEQALLRTALKRSLLLSLGLVLLSLPLSVLLAHTLSRPILSLAGVANRFREGDLKARATAAKQDEIGLLGHAFNMMLDRTQELLDDLEQERALSRSIVDTVPVGIVCLDADHRVVFVNPTLRELLPEAPGVGDTFPGSLRVAGLAGALGRARQGVTHESLECHLTTRSEPARTLSLLITVSRVSGELKKADGEDDHKDSVEADTLVVFDDLTDIQEASERFKMLFGSAPDPILISDSAGRIQEANEETERVFGYPVAELKGNALSMLMPEVDLGVPSKVTSGQVRMLTMDSRATETTGARKDGTQLPIEFRRSFLPSTDGTLVTNIVRDRSEHHRLVRELRQSIEKLKHTQRQLVQAGKMAAVGELAAGVAHEMNNPLTGVLTYSVLLKDSLAGLPPEVLDKIPKFASRLELIRKSAERCKSVADNLLAFSRQSSTTKAPVDIREVIRRCLELSTTSLRHSLVRVEQDFPDMLPKIAGSFSQLQQVITNITINAAQAMPEGGVLRFSAEPADDNVRIYISDTGPGIPEHVRERIFEPFYTTKEVGKGTGLGLSIVYGIIERHGGTVEIESEVGQGTTFTITLPAAVVREVSKA